VRVTKTKTVARMARTRVRTLTTTNFGRGAMVILVVFEINPRHKEESNSIKSWAAFELLQAIPRFGEDELAQKTSSHT